jgi:MFS family permease
MSTYGMVISGGRRRACRPVDFPVAGNLNRRTALLMLTALMAVSGLVVALAPNYPVNMIGRALIGVVIGGFWSFTNNAECGSAGVRCGRRFIGRWAGAVLINQAAPS